MNDQNTAIAETAEAEAVINPEQLTAQPPAMPDTFTVKVFDLHNGAFFEYPQPNMDTAINFYKALVQQQRDTQPRPFVYLDDAHWIALVKFNGGLVRQVWIADQNKVRGHNAGMRRREAAKTLTAALPPSIVPAAVPATVTSPASHVAPAETMDDVPF